MEQKKETKKQKKAAIASTTRAEYERYPRKSMATASKKRSQSHCVQFPINCNARKTAISCSRVCVASTKSNDYIQEVPTVTRV
jgi:hypothetical protein